MAIDWITIVVTDLNDYLVGAQVSALRTAALAAGQADPFTAIMPDIVNRIRLKIESCKTNRVSATALTIPPELKWIACYLIIEAMQVRLPALKLTEDQKNQVKAAKDELNLIAKCDSVVSEPTDPLEPGDAQVGGAIEIASKTTRQFTRDKLSGF